MKKVILTGFLMVLSNSIYAMDTRLNPSIEGQDRSTTMRSIDARDMGSLLVSQINVDSFRTIIRDAVTDVLGERLPSDAEEMVDIAIKVAARGVEREHIAQMRILATQAQAEIDRREDAHTHELAALESQKTEAERQRRQAEKISTLRGILLRIPILDKNPIRLRATNIIELDILERHKKVDELYRRFLPYSELYGRSDLGVIATVSDLKAVERYLDEIIVVRPEFPDPSKLPNSGYDYSVWGGYNRANGVTYDAQIKQVRTTLDNLPPAFKRRFASWISSVNNRLDAVIKDTSQLYQGEIVMTSPYKGGMKYYQGRHGAYHLATWDADGRFNSAIAALREESTKRYAVLQEILGETELQQILRTINEVVFPSESFNRLVDQVNRFFIEGLQGEKL